MMPIVFWASLVPWASETSEAAPIWPQRKPLRLRWAWPPPETLCTSRVPTVGDHAGDDRRQDRRHDDLADDAVDLGAVADPLDAAGAERGQRGADDAAEQRVRGARRQPQQPGEHVPEDAADQAREDDDQQQLAVVVEQLGPGRAVVVLEVDHRVGDGQRDGDREERAEQVHHGREGHGGLGLEGAGGDRRSDRVAGVVEAVGEIEEECGADHAQQDEERCSHGVSVGCSPIGCQVGGWLFTQCSSCVRRQGVWRRCASYDVSSGRSRAGC